MINMMKDEINFIELDDDKKKALLYILGFELNDEGILINKENGTPHICPITNKEVAFEDASVLPWNSSIVINTNPMSLSKYFSEYRKLKEKNHNDR